MSKFSDSHALETVTCAYDKNHKVQPHRLAIHLSNCRKKYPNSGLEICPFNVVHHIPKEQMGDHLLVCDAKKRWNLTPTEHQLPEGVNLGPRPPLPTTDDDEVWESVPGNEFKPELMGANLPVMRRTPVNLTKTEKKLWRQTELERIQSLEACSDLNQNTQQSQARGGGRGSLSLRGRGLGH